MENFIIEVQQLLKNDESSVIVLDNDWIHHNLSLPEGAPREFLRPYSPLLNPNHSVFSVVKIKSEHARNAEVCLARKEQNK